MAKSLNDMHRDPRTSTDNRQRRIEIDVERYQALLDAPDFTTAQKQDFIAALWTIIGVVLDLGLGVHPVQAVLDERTRKDPNR